MQRLGLALLCSVLGLLVVGGSTGCSSSSSTMMMPTGPTGGAALTWYKHALPIMQESCQGCHGPGGIGPFPLVTYEDAVAHADAIAVMVETRQMPPWLPSDSADCASLDGNRRLSDAEVATLVDWARGDRALGDPKDAPMGFAPPAGLDQPDLELQPPVDYTPDARVMDDYRCFILDPQLATDRDVVAFEVLPGQVSEVHHVLLYPADRAKALAKDAQTPSEPGWTCYGGPGVPGSDSPLGGWVPGSGAVRFPPTTGVTLKGGDVLVMQVHYNLANGAAPDRTRVRLALSPTPVANPALYVALLNDSFSIPPNAKGHSAVGSYTVPVGVKVWGVTPHMHTHGRKIRVEAGNRCLIDIPRWDFHWQQFYFFEGGSYIEVPAQTEAKVTCTWDNPTTVPVTWGEGTNDEMCLNYFFVTL